MIRTLEILFSIDFEERYKKYKAKILGTQETISPNLAVDFNSTRKAQTNALERTLAQGENNEKIKREIIEELKNKEQMQSGSNSVKADTKLTFDSLNGVLRYSDITHSFHRGSKGEEKRLVFFRRLWEEKKVIKNGIVNIKGNPFPPEALAVQLGIVNYAGDFNINARAKNQIFSMVKGINKIFRDKEVPAYIERQNGIQLIVTEK